MAQIGCGSDLVRSALAITDETLPTCQLPTLRTRRAQKLRTGRAFYMAMYQGCVAIRHENATTHHGEAKQVEPPWISDVAKQCGALAAGLLKLPGDVSTFDVQIMKERACSSYQYYLLNQTSVRRWQTM